MTDDTRDVLSSEDQLAFAAWSYAEMGWRVLPVHSIREDGTCTCQSSWMPPCASPGKEPIHSDWPNAATTDKNQIAQWWGAEHVGANVGIATGAGSGIWVLDVDEGVRKNGTYKEGLDSYVKLTGDNEELPRTRTHRTGGGGSQYFFRIPDGIEIKSKSKGLGDRYPDIDVRGEGGQVVAPPSVSGKGPYTVEDAAEVAETPGWLIQILMEEGTATLTRQAPHASPAVTGASANPTAVTAVDHTPVPGWFAASMDAKLQTIRDAPEGQGNETINRISYMVGQYIPNGWILRQDAEARLLDAVQSWAVPHPAAAYTIGRALDQGAQHPYQDLATVAGGGELSDAVISERICGELLSGRFCWAAGLDWLSWDGHVWAMVPDVEVTESVRKYMVAEVQQALPLVAANASARRELVNLLSRAKITNVVQLARGIIQVKPDRFDNQPDLLNTPSGVVDLRDGTLRSSDPGLYFMKITDAEYRPDATHPDWDAALTAVPDCCREWLRVRIGQALTGYMTNDDSLVLLQGTGENGKSTVLAALMASIGSFAVMVPNNAMTGRADDAHALMPFMGARMALVEELPEGRRLNATRLKETVGTPTMTGRYMYKNLITWKSTHSLFLTTNYIPTVNETDHGTWRRLLLLRFPYRFVKPGRPLERENDRHGDPHLRQRLMDGKEQQAAALAWAVQGAVEWYRSGHIMPEPPPEVEQDTRQWRRDADLVLGYWDDRLEADPESHVVVRELIQDFKLWLRSTGHPSEWSDKLISMRFSTHDETLNRRVTHGQLRVNDRLSRPAILEGSPVPERYKAWSGLRFKKST